MTLREEIVAEVQSLPETVLPELQETIKKLKERETKPSLMEQLREIKIQGPPDFSRNIDLYLNGEKNVDDVR